MSRAIKYKRMVGKGSEHFPSVLVKFKGENQAAYFQLRALAEAKGMNQTELCRMILADYAKKNFKEKAAKFVEKQETLKLENPVIRVGKKRKTEV